VLLLPQLNKKIIIQITQDAFSFKEWLSQTIAKEAKAVPTPPTQLEDITLAHQPLPAAFGKLKAMIEKSGGIPIAFAKYSTKSNCLYKARVYGELVIKKSRFPWGLPY